MPLDLAGPSSEKEAYCALMSPLQEMQREPCRFHMLQRRFQRLVGEEVSEHHEVPAVRRRSAPVAEGGNDDCHPAHRYVCDCASAERP